MGISAAAQTASSLLERARAIVPEIRKHRNEAERERRLSKPVLDALTSTGLVSMFTPRSLGGLEVDPINCAQVMEEVARADSAAGWSLFNPLAWAFISARLPDQGAEELFANSPNAVIAGPFHPPMQAIASDGGYRVTGRSPFASNCHDADWIGTTIILMDGDKPKLNQSGTPEVRIVFLSVNDCEILDTWYVMGMRGTGSDDISIKDAFVPAARTAPLTPEFKPGSHYHGPLYRFSMMGSVAATFAPIVLAIARNAIDEVYAIAQRKTPFGSNTLLRERAATQMRLAQAEAALRSARALLYETLGEAWERAVAGRHFSLQHKADLLLATANATSSAARVADLMYGVAGTTGIYTKNPLEQHFRDLQVLKQHGFASESRYEAVGQLYLGVSPEWVPVVL